MNKLRNDSVYFDKFNWKNRENPAKKVAIDLLWISVSDNTLVFLDAWLENDRYVTIGLRQEENGIQRAHMTVWGRGIPASCGNDFQYEPNKTEPTYCIGPYPFRLLEYYQLILLASDEWIEGQIVQKSNNHVTIIGRFYPGTSSLIKAGSPNAIALEKVGMLDPCKSKSCISIRSPIRLDIFSKLSTATEGRIVCNDSCTNINVYNDSKGNVIISHGGDTPSYSRKIHHKWIKW